MDLKYYKYALEASILIYNIKENNITYNVDTDGLNDERINILNNIDGDINFFKKYKNGVECGIITNHILKCIIIIFRGSDSILDWIYNLCLFKKCLKDKIYVHYGFYKQLELVKNELLRELNIIYKKYEDYSLFITGHSLGGALGILFGYYISDIINKYIRVISFGSPRIGNIHFKNSFESKKNIEHIRFINNRDPVVSIPYFWYYHVGYKIYLNYNYSFNKYSRKLITKDNDNDNLLYFNNIKDHDIMNYYYKINSVFN